MKRLALLASLAAAPALAVDLSVDIDAAVKAGVVSGTVESSSNPAAGVGTFGGSAIGLVFYHDLSPSWSSCLSPELAIDVTTRSILRKGVSAGLLLHLLGGSKRLEDKLYNAAIESGTGYGLSLFGRGAFFDYTARDPQNRIEPLKGSVTEIAAGIEIRVDIGATTSFALQAASTVASLASSADGLSTKMTDVTVLWRRYL